MSAPEPRETKTCPECGAQLSARAEYCWLCRKPLKAAVAGHAVTPIKVFSVFWLTLAIVAVVFVAAAIAFFTTCIGGFFVGMAVSGSMGRSGEESLGWGFMAGISLGVIAALVVALFCARYLVSRARRTPQP